MKGEHGQAKLLKGQQTKRDPARGSLPASRKASLAGLGTKKDRRPMLCLQSELSKCSA